MLKHDLRFSLLLALGAALTMGLKVRAIGYDRATDSPAFTRALQASLERDAKKWTPLFRIRL